MCIRDRITVEITSLVSDDLEGLPEDLLVELSVSKADKTEFLIAQLIQDHQGIMSLDQILIAYYRATKEVIKRPAMTNRLYRMAQKGMVYSVPGKKGIYTTEPVNEKLETVGSESPNEGAQPDLLGDDD